MHNVDEVLGDLDVNIPARVRFSHWLNPINPVAYRKITPKVLAKLAEPTPEPKAAQPERARRAAS
jgi:hypothetical protein